MATPLRVLILEDNPSDAELVLQALRRAGYDPIGDRVETEQDFRDRLATGPRRSFSPISPCRNSTLGRSRDHARVPAGHSLHHRFGHHRRGARGAGHATRGGRLHHERSVGAARPGGDARPGKEAVARRETSDGPTAAAKHSLAQSDRRCGHCPYQGRRLAGNAPPMRRIVGSQSRCGDGAHLDAQRLGERTRAKSQRRGSILTQANHGRTCWSATT